MKKSYILDELSVKNFKGFSNGDFKELGAFNLFVGANDIGKTSILEAIFLLSGISNLDLLIRIQNHRRILVQSFDDLSYLFHNLDLSTPIELIAKSGILRQKRELKISSTVDLDEPDSPPQIIQPKNANDSYGFSPDESGLSRQTQSQRAGHTYLRYDGKITGTKRENSRDYKGEMKVYSHENIHTYPPPKDDGMVISASITRPGIEYDTQNIADIIVSKREDQLLEILTHINPSIRRIAVRKDAVYLDVGLEKMVPLNMFGSGLIRAANVLALCILGDARIVLIDEIENGLHYTAGVPLLKALLSLAVQREVQIFATTHSLMILRALQEILNGDEFGKLRDEAVVYSLSKDRENQVRSYRYGYSEFDHCIKNSLEMR